MNKLLVALIAGAFVSVAGAQTNAPKPTAKQRAADVSATTQAGSTSSTGATTAAQQAANTRASKEVAKMTKAEKEAFIKALSKEPLNPENPSGNTAATAAQAKANTAESKMMPKANTELKTKEGQKQLSQDLNKASQGGGGSGK